MKVNKELAHKILVKTNIVHKKNYVFQSISEEDEVKEQLMAMQIFLTELIVKIDKKISFDQEFVNGKIELILSYLEWLDTLPTKSESIEKEEYNPYSNYIVHN